MCQTSAQQQQKLLYLALTLQGNQICCVLLSYYTGVNSKSLQRSIAPRQAYKETSLQDGVQIIFQY